MAKLRKRHKKVCGVGINDADYMTQIFSLKSRKPLWICPFYKVWKNLIVRCFDLRLQEKYPTYKGCTVCEEWLIFSNFKAWMETQDWKGKELDKDILSNANLKLYSPETCCFVSKTLNRFLLKGNSTNNGMPTGVNPTHGGRFIALCCNPFTKKQERLGKFEDEVSAHLAWIQRKLNIVDEMWASNIIEDVRVYSALRDRFNHILMNYINSEEK